MKKLKFQILTVLLAGMSLIACGTIESGNVGVRTSSLTGKVEPKEIQQGFYTALLSSVDKYSAKEITVKLFDMKPKAKDNLTLEDMDIELYYRAKPGAVAELHIKYANRHAYDRAIGVYYPAYELIRSLGREATYKVVSQYDSLEIHKNREQISKSIWDLLQTKLNQLDSGVFTITNIVVRNTKTDSSVEEAIKRAVAKNKELEAATLQIKIAREQAKANRALDASLTRNVLRHKELEVMQSAVENGSKPLVIFGSGTPLINVR